MPSPKNEVQEVEMAPFDRFWAALNEHLAARGLPEITYGPAHRLWVETGRRATIEVIASLSSGDR